MAETRKNGKEGKLEKLRLRAIALPGRRARDEGTPTLDEIGDKAFLSRPVDMALVLDNRGPSYFSDEE